MQDEINYHPACSTKIFGKPIPPEITYTENDILELAIQVVKSQRTITGVQPKLSLNIEKISGQRPPHRFTIVGLWGNYILKPQTENSPNLPEIEDLTMHLAQITQIKTVKHSLVRLKSGQLAYITKRVDRINGKKLHMEDMCQLTNKLTEHKYNGSYEQIAKEILNHTSNSGFDVISFYEQVIFSFLTGNNDMHLKKFSLLKDEKSNYNLCPAYDLVASELVVVGDEEELALNLNGKKKKLKRKDFEVAMKNANIEEKVIENTFKKFAKILPKWHEFIDISFVPNKLKKEYQDMIRLKETQIEINPST